MIISDYRVFRIVQAAVIPFCPCKLPKFFTSHLINNKNQRNIDEKTILRLFSTTKHGKHIKSCTGSSLLDDRVGSSKKGQDNTLNN